MPGLSKFTVSKFAVSTFFNSVSKIQTLDTKTHKCCWHRPRQTGKRIRLSTYLLKQDSWETETLPFCEERVKVVTSTKWEPCFVFFFPSVLRWLKSIYPGLKVTAILSARTDPIDRWQLLLFEVGHSQMIHAWPCCHIRKAKRK